MSQRVPEISVVIAVGEPRGLDRSRDSLAWRRTSAVWADRSRSWRSTTGRRTTAFRSSNILAGSIPELRVLGREALGRPFLRGSSEARGDVVVLLDAGKTVSLAPLGWALSRLGAGRDAVVLRGRYMVARRLAALPVIVRASGPGLLFEAVFERRAQELGIDVVGSRPAPPDAAPAPSGAPLPGGLNPRSSWCPAAPAVRFGLPVLVLP